MTTPAEIFLKSQERYGTTEQANDWKAAEAQRSIDDMKRMLQPLRVHKIRSQNMKNSIQKMRQQKAEISYEGTGDGK